MRLVLSAVLSASLFALAACSGSAPSPQASASAGGMSNPVDADPLAPDNAPHVSVVDPVINLPAVPGNPGVLYFTIQQDTGGPSTLAAVHVDGVGRAEMHESKTVNGVTTMDKVSSVTFGPDKPAEFKPGSFHVMLFDLASTLTAGGKDAEVTFTLANGDKVSTIAKVQAAGGALEHMAHM
jgi:periplasmic copper chaperone A